MSQPPTSTSFCRSPARNVSAAMEDAIAKKSRKQFRYLLLSFVNEIPSTVQKNSAITVYTN